MADKSSSSKTVKNKVETAVDEADEAVTEQIEAAETAIDSEVQDDSLNSGSDDAEESDVPAEEELSNEELIDPGETGSSDPEADFDADEYIEDLEETEHLDDVEYAEYVEDDVVPDPEYAEPIPEAVAVAAASEPVRQRGGFFPGLIGGVISAGVILAGAYYYFGNQSDGAADQLAALANRQTEQGTALAELSDVVSAGPDLSAVTGQIEAAIAQLGGLSDRIDVIAGDISGLSDRITEIEKRPITDSVSKEAIAAYEAELERLRNAMAEQREEVEALVDEARKMESDASATAEATLRRAALTRILSALDSGSPYGAALADLRAAGQQVPEALAASAETGAPSLSDLRNAFPAAARRALAAARSNNGDTGGSIRDFLRDQLGARSLEPRDGDDADAILSRAESSLKAGRLGDTLAELDTLPDGARAEMAGWIADAQTRQSAVQAAEDLSAALDAS
ncbi:MAG: hypothetical protein ACRBBU_14365 [Pseudooceanicola sp.]